MDGYIQARKGTYTDVTRSRNGMDKTGQKLRVFARGRVYKVVGSTKTKPKEKRKSGNAHGMALR